MAGAGYKDWTAGEKPTAAQFDNYLQEQTIMRFASAAARDTALTTAKAEGMHAYLDDTNTLTVYTGSVWSTVGPAHGGLTSWTPTVTQSGSVTVTNNASTYQRMGRLVTAFFDLTVTGSGTGNNDVVISMPVACRTGISVIGGAQLFDTSATAPYIGHCRTSSTTAFRLHATNILDNGKSGVLGSTTFTAGLASGDTITGFITYEAAADA
jgi:hypothetical protein